MHSATELRALSNLYKAIRSQGRVETEKRCPTAGNIVNEMLLAARERARSGCGTLSWPKNIAWGFINTIDTEEAPEIAKKVFEQLHKLGYKVEPCEFDPDVTYDDEYHIIPSGHKAYKVIIWW